jgi:hypothetical protein
MRSFFLFFVLLTALPALAQTQPGANCTFGVWGYYTYLWRPQRWAVFTSDPQALGTTVLVETTSARSLKECVNSSLKLTSKFGQTLPTNLPMRLDIFGYSSVKIDASQIELSYTDGKNKMVAYIRIDKDNADEICISPEVLLTFTNDAWLKSKITRHSDTDCGLWDFSVTEHYNATRYRILGRVTESES